MGYYYNSYLETLKKNFMLIIMALMLLIPTFFIWAGIPFFVVSSIVGRLTVNPILLYLSISLSGGFLFSLYFLPFNLKVAQNLSFQKKQSRLLSLLQLQTGWTIGTAIIFVIIMFIVV